MSTIFLPLKNIFWPVSGYIFRGIAMLLFLIWPAFAQGTPPARDSLPEIYLQEYTIVGLEKVVLPEKERRIIFKKVPGRWIENQHIRQKSSPLRVFAFSRLKPTIVASPVVNRFSARIAYGSFNTLRADILAQFRVRHVQPYVRMAFNRSDGHLPGAQSNGLRLGGGVEGQPWKNSLLQLQLQLERQTQGLWGSVLPRDALWKVKRQLWQGRLHWQQRWTKRWQLNLNTEWLQESHESYWNTRQRVLQGEMHVQYRWQQTTLFLKGGYQVVDTELGPSAQSRPAPVQSVQKNLPAVGMGLAHQFGLMAFRVGFLLQSNRDGDTPSRVQIWPQFQATMRLTPGLHLTGSFDAGYRLLQNRYFSQFFLPADFSTYAMTKVLQDWQLGVKYTPFTDVQLNYMLRYLDAANYPVVESLLKQSTAGVTLPLWRYRYANQVQLIEHTFHVLGKLAPRFRLEGWIMFRQTRLKGTFLDGQPLAEKDVPYLPNLEAWVDARWQLWRETYFHLSTRFVGRRFDDLNNTDALEPYLLINAQLRASLGRHFLLIVCGENLLNQTYDLWKTMEAPPILGAFTLGIRF